MKIKKELSKRIIEGRLKFMNKSGEEINFFSSKLTQKTRYGTQRHDEEADKEIGHGQWQQEIVRHIVEFSVQAHCETNQYVSQSASDYEHRHE